MRTGYGIVLGIVIAIAGCTIEQEPDPGPSPPPPGPFPPPPTPSGPILVLSGGVSCTDSCTTFTEYCITAVVSCYNGGGAGEGYVSCDLYQQGAYVAGYASSGYFGAGQTLEFSIDFPEAELLGDDYYCSCTCG